ncbi:SDR family NAD(P)-dependent oxidoreductase [Streptomyces sp. WI04-05B]|uniref:SDR family NAD(P)-dependent oxidoreductase n=1 Tax=Streptomyces TaxID=1883 RepID=UPI0029B55C21|nr:MULTISPECIES: glucose 1-dehydrogenase [unclassified Streptomyces]MDX2542446.1 glucose 1-dehydrogenase [Streptomyces sp. WI04-05B]MDX2582535.1 glucose 1-dehydrogenase [Streptomyces sp. WI04-05A]
MLHGRVAMITGASSGIGAAAARLFAAEGAAVVLTARRAEPLETLAEEIRGLGGRALAVPGDVTRAEDMAHVVERAVDTFGHLDAAFNNAGYATAGLPLHEIDDATYEQTIDVNLRGVWNCLRHQIPAMLDSGRGGAVVNTSSVAGTAATGASAAYVAAKHAVIGLTKAAAADYGVRGIRVNALVVGSTRTEMMEQVLQQAPELEEAFAAASIQRRMADPVEVARTAAWLCSDQASFVTGAAVPVDGGATATH